MSTQSDRRGRYRDSLQAWSTIVVLVIIILSSGLAQARQTTDYCRAGLCPRGTHHIACNGNNKFGKDCSSRPMLIKMTPKYVNLILNYHNSKRNRLACGSMRRFASATSMQKLRWNDELAHLAEYNAKSCNFAHDECHNTDRFPFTGQSIGMKWFHGMNLTATQVVRDLIRKWYLEHKLTKQRDLDHFEANDHSFVIGHFTQMIHADTTEIGCALVISRNDPSTGRANDAANVRMVAPEESIGASVAIGTICNESRSHPFINVAVEYLSVNSRGVP
ncbi:AAEL004407-PB [Aedes aegypti]|uniref:AAEL004407-PB n=1 Tax=Aedes aegypti TaxID=7159 RepID=Q17CW8_AEDAE|nr:AAEL004407-PB [Aedes aegypti]